MPPPVVNPESLTDMGFPMHGLNLVAEFERQPPGSTVQGKNVRAFDLYLQRMRGGSRPGLVKYISSQVLGISSKIQHVNIIVDPTEAALTSGFFDPNDPDGLIDDPSTNNKRIRNPGRRIRTHGSGKGLNMHLKGTKVRGQSGSGSSGSNNYPISLPAGATSVTYTGTYAQDVNASMVGSDVQVNVSRAWVGTPSGSDGPVQMACTLHQVTDAGLTGGPCLVVLPPNAMKTWINGDLTTSYGCGS